MFLKQVKDIERRFAHVVLQAPALERGGAAIDGIDLHNAEQIQNVPDIERVVVADRSPEIAALGAKVAPFVDTSLGKDRIFVTVRLIGIVVEVGIVVLNDRGGHRTVGLRLIRAVLDVVLGARSLIFDCPKGRNFDFRSNLPFEFSLEFHVAHIQVHIVLGQLVLDVERSVIARIEFIRVERARRTQCIGVGVDVELALHLARHVVSGRRQGSRCLLFTIGTVGNQVQRQVFEDVVGGVDVGRVAFHLAGLRPSRVAHGAQ